MLALKLETAVFSMEKDDKKQGWDGIGGYGADSLYTLDLSRERWDEESKHPHSQGWNTTPQGRFAIRSFSRGVLGAAFFAWGGHFANRSMAGYHPERAPENWVQLVARIFDKTAGVSIEKSLNAMGYDGHRAVTFRPTRQFYGGQYGRTLGHEVIGVTFDFAAMSVGDAMGRDIAALVDPNIQHSWRRDDGSVDVPQAMREIATNTFRYLTYNQGEDWAVALPYVYYLRWQRNTINKFSPGFAYDSDRSLNGGSFKVNSAGQIIGNYQLEGMLDLQGRFTAYNVGTLMFREAYTKTADKLMHWMKDDFSTSDIDQSELAPNSLLTDLNNLGAWALRDVVKGTLYMTPAVPFFWAGRSPQSKYKGLMIHPEYGPISYTTGAAAAGAELVHMHEERRSTNINRPERFTRDTPTYFSHFDRESGQWTLRPAPNPFAHGTPDPYARTYGPVDAVFNPLGDASNEIRRAMHEPVGSLQQKYGIFDDSVRWKRHSDAYTNAALTYTPYFWAKTEFANLWDNARMDIAIDRALSGAGNLKPGEFMAGLHEMGRVLQQKELTDPEREAQAKEAIRTDVSAADIFDPKVFQFGKQAKTQELPQPQLEKPNTEGFVERLQLHKKHATDRLEQYKKTARPAPLPKAALDARPTSHTEQEAARTAGEGELPKPGTTLH